MPPNGRVMHRKPYVSALYVALSDGDICGKYLFLFVLTEFNYVSQIYLYPCAIVFSSADLLDSTLDNQH